MSAAGEGRLPWEMSETDRQNPGASQSGRLEVPREDHPLLLTPLARKGETRGWQLSFMSHSHHPITKDFLVSVLSCV